MLDLANPLGLPDYWTILHGNPAKPEYIERQGLLLTVAILSVGPDGQTVEVKRPEPIRAIIDTGSDCCCVSEEMFALLSGGVKGTRNVAHIHGKVEGEQTVRADLTWHKEMSFFRRDFSILRHLDPWDVLIGRDVLKDCHLYIDGPGGQFWLYAPKETPIGP